MNRSFRQFKATREEGSYPEGRVYREGYNRKEFSVTKLMVWPGGGAYKRDFTEYEVKVPHKLPLFLVRMVTCRLARRTASVNQTGKLSWDHKSGWSARILMYFYCYCYFLLFTFFWVWKRCTLLLQVAGWSLSYYSKWLDEQPSEQERLALIR